MSNRPSHDQLEGLVEFLEQNSGIAKGLLRTTQAKVEIKRKWATLATTLNSLGGANKDGQGWAKYWAEKKCALKKHCALLSASMRRTGGGSADTLPALSALDSRLVAVMGGHSFATGDSRLTVNPFPTSVTNEPVTNEPAAIIESVAQDDTGLLALPMSPVPSTSQHVDVNMQEYSTMPAHRTIPRPRRRSSIPRPVDMDRFANIEERRVEAESTTARALATLSENTAGIVTGLMSVANALLEIARKMPSPTP